MAAERPSEERSLKLDDVVQRFNESEALLGQARQQLVSLLEAERASKARAQALSEAAQAVASYSARAERLLKEAERSVHLASETLEASARLLDGSELTDLKDAVRSLAATQAEQFQSTQAELAKLNATSLSLAATQTEQFQGTQAELAKLYAAISSLSQELTAVRKDQAWLRTRRLLRL